jgi:hypothetical protein
LHLEKKFSSKKVQTKLALSCNLVMQIRERAFAKISEK